MSDRLRIKIQTYSQIVGGGELIYEARNLFATGNMFKVEIFLSKLCGRRQCLKIMKYKVNTQLSRPKDKIRYQTEKPYVVKRIGRSQYANKNRGDIK